MSGHWLARQADTPPPHTCAPPVVGPRYGVVEEDSPDGLPVGTRYHLLPPPDGVEGDLWQCDCGKAHRIVAGCEWFGPEWTVTRLTWAERRRHRREIAVARNRADGRTS